MFKDRGRLFFDVEVSVKRRGLFSPYRMIDTLPSCSPYFLWMMGEGARLYVMLVVIVC